MPHGPSTTPSITGYQYHHFPTAPAPSLELNEWLLAGICQLDWSLLWSIRVLVQSAHARCQSQLAIPDLWYNSALFCMLFGSLNKGCGGAFVGFPLPDPARDVTLIDLEPNSGVVAHYDEGLEINVYLVCDLVSHTLTLEQHMVERSFVVTIGPQKHLFQPLQHRCKEGLHVALGLD